MQVYPSALGVDGEMSSGAVSLCDMTQYEVKGRLMTALLYVVDIWLSNVHIRETLSCFFIYIY